MSYQDALKYLNSFINYEKKDDYDYKGSFNLERMEKFIGLLGSPQREIKSIHIAGTKGKGSTACIVHSILKNAGLKTGLYTSPHLISFRERIRMNDSLISEDDTSRLLERLKTAVVQMGKDVPTFFEIYTALAHLYFKEKKADIAVYETGLGGRLDATNVLEPLVCAITRISYDHTQKLGNTLGEIAAEKAGIIKDNCICVSAPQEREALDTIRDVCKDKNARLILVGEDIKFKEISFDDSKEIFNVTGMFGEYPLLEMNLLGFHQVENAATAIGIIEALRLHNIAIGPEVIRNGIRAARWEGRLEVIRKRPLIVIDGAHNRASAKALASSIRRAFRYRRLILVLGVSKDKDIKGILEEVLPIADMVILTKSNIAERATDPIMMREFIKGREVIITSNVEEAIDSALSTANEDDLVLITGSLFVVGEARELWTTQSSRFRRR